MDKVEAIRRECEWTVQIIDLYGDIDTLVTHFSELTGCHSEIIFPRFGKMGSQGTFRRTVRMWKGGMNIATRA